MGAGRGLVVPGRRLGHQGRSQIVGKGDGLLALNHKVEGPVQVEARLGFLPREHISQAIASLIPQVAQQPVHPVIQILIRALAQLNPRAGPGGMAEGVIVAQGTVGVQGQQAVLLQHAVEVQGILHIRLPMVAHDDEVGMLKIAIPADGLHQHAQLHVVAAQLILGLLAAHAHGVAHGVQVAHLDKHHIRLAIVADDVRGHRVGESVEASMEHGRHAAEQVAVLPEIAVDDLGRTVAVEKLAGIIAMVVHGHAHGQVDVHIRPGGNRPVQQAGGIARVLRILGEELLLHHAALAEPRHGVHPGFNHFIVGNAVLVRVAPCHDGHMAGIGKGGINGLNLLHQRAILEHPAEIRQGAHEVHVALAKRVDHKHKNLWLIRHE